MRRLEPVETRVEQRVIGVGIDRKTDLMPTGNFAVLFL
jgi:hypothetical protein